jgi:hypothetical protein
MDIRGPDRASNIPRRLDLLCDHLRLFVGLWLGLDSCPHPRRLPENLPTPTNSIVLFVVLCLFIFGLMAFAKFMQQRERKRSD